MESDTLPDSLQIDISNISPYFIPNEQYCHISLHSISPGSDSCSYKAYSVLVSEPNPSCIVLTQGNLIQDDVLIEDEISIFTQFSLEISHGERWVEVTIFDMNVSKSLLTTAIELSLLNQLHPYHMLVTSSRVSAKLSILKIPSSLYYHTFSGLELAFVPGIANTPTPTFQSMKSVISLEVMNLKPPSSYKPNAKFTSYSKQHSKTQTFYLATPAANSELERNTAQYTFLPDACFKFRMDSHFVVFSLSRLDSTATNPWFFQSPEVLCYLELDPGTLSSLANRSLIRNVTDKVVYLKGNQSVHGYQTLIRMKRKDDQFMTLSPPPPPPPSTATNPPECPVSRTEVSRVREELEKVRTQRDELKRLNEEYEEKLNTYNSVQHLPSFSLKLLEQSNKSELIHKYALLQQERDLLSRKLDQSKELVDSLYVSLEGFSELQESFSEVQESNLIQQEIVRHLQERAARYKKLAKLCQTQERTIQSYEEHFQKLLDSQRGPSDVFTPAPHLVEYGVESVRELTEMEGKSDRLVSALQERLLQSSLRHRNTNYSQKMEASRELHPRMHHSDHDITDVMYSRDETYSNNSNAESLTNDLHEIIQSIPKLDKLSF